MLWLGQESKVCLLETSLKPYAKAESYLLNPRPQTTKPGEIGEYYQEDLRLQGAYIEQGSAEGRVQLDWALGRLRVALELQELLNGLENRS